jgi:hypothetical protein
LRLKKGDLTLREIQSFHQTKEAIV